MADDTRFPPSLTALDDWCNWDPDTKRPMPAVGHPLLSFRTALKREPDHVGFHFTADNPYAGIDLDKMTPFAQTLMSMARGSGLYRERSPSGRGWHIIGQGGLPGRGLGHVDGVEAYDAGRYFTMTGDAEAGGSVDVSIQPLLDLIVEARGARDQAGEAKSELVEEVQAAFASLGLLRGVSNEGKLGVWCPWDAEHTTESNLTSTVLMDSGFRCLHAHCEGRTLADVIGWLDAEHGKKVGDYATPDDFPMLLPLQADLEIDPEPAAEKKSEVLVWLKDWNLPEPSWTVEGFMSRGDMVHVFGAPEAGKSLLMQSLAVAMARGDAEWLGLKVTRPGPVLYLMAEGQMGVRERLEGLAGPDWQKLPIMASTVALPLPEHEETVKEIVHVDGMHFELVIVDTLRGHVTGSDNEADVVEALFKSVRDQVARRWACPIVWIHHSGHNEPDRGRGSSNIRAAMDIEWKVERAVRGAHRAECMKWRGGDREALSHVEFSVSEGWKVESMSFADEGVVVTQAEATDERVARRREQVLDGVRQGLTAPAMVTALRVSRSTIYSDLQALQEADEVFRDDAGVWQVSHVGPVGDPLA